MSTRIPALLEQADDAAEFVSGRLYARHPEYAERFGEKGRKACRADIVSHITFIDGAIEADSAVPFAEYLRWLRAVLKTRGIDDASLAESVQLIGDYFEDHLEPHEKALLRRILTEGVAALHDTRTDGVDPAWLRWQPPAAEAAAPLTEHLAAGNIPAVRGVVHEVRDTGANYLDMAVRLFQPALYRIGTLWQQNRVSVAQEHLATAIVQNQLAQLYAAADVGPANGRRALFACVEGNQHAIGLRMVCDAFELAGWEVQYLGANLPLAALIAQVAALKPDLVGLSASLAQQIPALRTAILALRAEFGADCPEIMIGGLATNQIEHVWRSVDADRWAPSADRAVARGESQVSSS